MRHLLARLLRTIERSGFWFVISIVGYLASAIKDVTEADGHEIRPAIIISILIGLVLLVRESRFRIWKFLRPDYRGLDQFLRRIDRSSKFVGSFITDGAEHVMLDFSTFATSCEPLLSRVQFCADDPDANAVAAQINATAFRGSRYSSDAAQKLKRNAPIAHRNGFTFALLRSADGVGHVGLAAVFPVTTDGLALYMTGRLSDNDFKPVHIAKRSQKPAAVLIFLIAHSPIVDGKDVPPAADAAVLEDLIKTCLLQVGLIAAASRSSSDLLVLVANSSKKMQTLFTLLNFVERPECETADQEKVFSMRVSLKRVSEGKRIVAERLPEAGRLGLRASAPKP